MSLNKKIIKKLIPFRKKFFAKYSSPIFEPEGDITVWNDKLIVVQAFQEKYN
jgi:hypothetical protein